MKIKVDDLSVSYWGDEELGPKVLDGIDLEIASGEVVLVTGDSGCGKTTLLRCLNGLIPSFYEAHVVGGITVGEMLIGEQEPRDIAPVIAMVFQDPRSEFFTFDVTSELAFSCENYGIEPAEIAERISKVADVLGIHDLLGRRMMHLSSGESQKIAIASAMMLNPKVLLFDEPSANLDQESLLMLAGIIGRLKAHGVTVVVADHRLSYLADTLDRCLILRSGRLVADLNRDELHALSGEWFSQRGLRQLNPGAPNESEPLESQAAAGIHARGLSHAYLEGPVLWNLDIALPESGIVGIVGANGCGKSTFLRILMGTQRVKSGQILRNGKKWKPTKRVKDCAFVMQDVEYQLLGESVWDEMFVGISRDEASEAYAQELFEDFELEAFRDRHPMTLSGGQKQRLTIALACMKHSGVICLDEPTSGLDAKNMGRVARLLRKLADDSALILVITHDQEFANQTFDYVLALDEPEIRLRKYRQSTKGKVDIND